MHRQYIDKNSRRPEGAPIAKTPPALMMTNNQHGSILVHVASDGAAKLFVCASGARLFLRIKLDDNHVVGTALGEGVAVMATRSSVHWFSTRRPFYCWSRNVDEGDIIQSIAVGDGWVAVVTSNQLLHILSSTGIQRQVVCAPGGAVRLVGLDGLLAVFYGVVDIGFENEDWNVLLYAVSPTGEYVQALLPSHLPLGRKRKLEWSGFTDHSNLWFSDTAGDVFVRRKDGCWMKVLTGCEGPILEIKESRRTVVVAQTEDRLEDWPPGVVELGFSLPFLPLDVGLQNFELALGQEICLQTMQPFSDISRPTTEDWLKMGLFEVCAQVYVPISKNHFRRECEAMNAVETNTKLG